MNECFEVLRATLSQKPDLRKMVGDLCPKNRGRGALVARLTNETTGLPVQPLDFYTKEHLGTWRSEAEIRQRFPGLDSKEGELAGMLDNMQPNMQFFVIYVGAEQIPGGPQVPPPGYHLFGGFFGRFIPGTVYVDSHHFQKTGELRPSSDHGGAAPERITATKEIVFELCAHGGCDRRFEGVGAGGRSASAPKLFRCASCGIVKYCSAACQRGDWPIHKALCKQNNGR
ncbi:hypothetical protein M885DRAFT_232792 [Pelagophyceae sp. CCMP2097]|nr:hypothetical protein M885DRAFT_232792 [Pelagophyceae sp. CCMP2097]